jgi:hypothetical protein
MESPHLQIVCCSIILYESVFEQVNHICSHIVHENGSTLLSTTVEAVLHRLLPHCEGPVFPAYQNQVPANPSLPRNRGRGRSWSSGGAEQAVFEDPLEVQRLALVALGNLFVKAGAQLTGGHCSQALEVWSMIFLSLPV